ncbi:ATP-binding protein [Saccharicrinis sp. GN24d3]|uniref:ATP-binding protein n=1 Tax=Saccharicrinis sp. GN24d3 TaxID=3458416 RepID=UPI00403623C4
MKIGKVISVEYDKFRVKLFHETRNSTVNLNGQVYYFGNIGSYLKTINPTGDNIICEVIAVLDNNLDSKVFSNYNLDSSRELVIKPIGTLTKGNDFNMGVGIFPSIYSDVSIVTIEDIKAILSPVNSLKEEIQGGVHQEVEIGKSKNMINYKINLNINKLFNIHTAVLGNSGSGKSNTIAHILQEVYRKEANHANGAKTILFDVNGEYHRAFYGGLFEEIGTSFLKPNTNADSHGSFLLPYYLMNLDEWLAFLMASERTQKPFWERVLQECFKFYKIFNPDEGTKETKKFVNYIKWKVRNILLNILSQVDSDTTKMTAAKGAITQIKKTYTDFNGEIDEELHNDLMNFLETCNDLCLISFGSNNDSLSHALPNFIKGETDKFVSVSPRRERGNIVGYDTEVIDTHDETVFKQIDEILAIQTDSERLRPGEYFDYNFLQTAVDIVLLEEEARGNGRIREFTSTVLSRLDYFLHNPDCDFMRDNSTVFKDSIEYLENHLATKLDNDSDQLVLIDSSEVGNDVLELMTSVVSRMIFEFRKSKRGDDRRKSPVHLILDEAHRYIKKDADYILKENIFERIAREGRKFSLYLLISSQRPSELSSTVLSQCGNYIIHRIQNEVDMKYIYSVLPYYSDDYSTKIKQAVPGEALIFGNCVPMPLQVKINRANPDPNSENCNISNEWFKIKKEKEEAVEEKI